MPSTYSGAGRAISAIANTTPIGVTTSIPHGLTTGAVVDISGVATTYPSDSPNGQWTVTVTGGSSFTLNGSTAAGAHGAGGVAYVFPSSITEPSDGDLRNAASLNPAFSGLADCVAFLSATMGNLRVVGLNAGTWTVPAKSFFLYGYGGGGGGGGGAGGTNGNVTTGASGGGAGGGAWPSLSLVTGATPGETATVTIGAGGTSGAGGVTNGGAGADGGDGGDTTLVTTGGITRVFRGASGGAGGRAVINANAGQMASGGGPVRDGGLWIAGSGGPLTFGTGQYPQIANGQIVWRPPAAGGCGVTNSSIQHPDTGTSANGLPQFQGLLTAHYGGASGAFVGPEIGNVNPGGGPGGGGGGGPAGQGAQGGDSGAGGGSNNGGAGHTAAVHSGAGGGGGGGGGANTTASGAGGAGGVGGSGFLYAIYVAGPNQ